MKTYTRLTLPHEEVVVEKDRQEVLRLVAAALDPQGEPFADAQGQPLPRGYFEITDINGETIACNAFTGVTTIRTLSEDRLQEWQHERERMRSGGVLTH